MFAAGQAWQFKGWPGITADGSPVNIFAKSMHACVFTWLQTIPNMYLHCTMQVHAHKTMYIRIQAGRD